MTCRACRRSEEQAAFKTIIRRGIQRRTSYCIDCLERRAVLQRGYAEKDPESAIRATQKWRDKNRKYTRDQAKAQYKQLSKEVVRSRASKYYYRSKTFGRTCADRLTDAYVASTMNMTVAETPKDLIELQRARLLIRRATKGIANEPS